MACLRDGSIDSANYRILVRDLSDWQRRAVNTYSEYLDFSWEMTARAAKLIYFSLREDDSMWKHIALTIAVILLLPFPVVGYSRIFWRLVTIESRRRHFSLYTFELVDIYDIFTMKKEGLRPMIIGSIFKAECSFLTHYITNSLHFKWSQLHCPGKMILSCPSYYSLLLRRYCRRYQNKTRKSCSSSNTEKAWESWWSRSTAHHLQTSSGILDSPDRP